MRLSVLGTLFLAATVAAQPMDTVVKTELFQISLPGTWKEVPPDSEESVWVFQSEGQEQVTVSIFLANSRMEVSEIPSRFERMLEIRRDAERSQAPGIVLADAKTSERPNARVAFYTGIDGAERKTANFLIVNPAGIANFYYEALEPNESAFVERAERIFGAIGFVE